VKRRVIVIGPLPPPHHGVTVSTALVLANEQLRDRFEVQHLDTSDRRSLTNVGSWDVENVRVGAKSVVRLVMMLHKPTGVVYFPLSQGTPAFLRDSLFIGAASARGWKVAAHLRGSDFRTYYESSSLVVRGLIRTTLRRIDSVAVMGSSLRWLFEGLVPSDRIAVVANGTPELNRDRVPRDPDTVLFLSNLRRRKGVAEAVEAARLVLDQHPSARFVFVGDWPDAEFERSIRASAAAAGDRIEFRPATTDGAKDRLLATASIFLFPPVEPEGHPRVLLEALAAGLPVVTTDRGAIRDTVIDGEHGFVLPEPSPPELASRLLQLLRDQALRERMSNAARTQYLERFTQDRADRVLAEWLEHVAGS
jgi:glycosyltransferase involved in cell wall biosynthesis